MGPFSSSKVAAPESVRNRIDHDSTGGSKVDDTDEEEEVVLVGPPVLSSWENHHIIAVSRSSNDAVRDPHGSTEEQLGIYETWRDLYSTTRHLKTKMND